MDNGKCCNHDHVGDGELWLTVDELADLIVDGVLAVLALPGDATRAEQRAATRRRLDEQRAAAAVPPTRAEQRDERARRRWS